MQVPQEIIDVGHEQVLSRVASVDVAKASGMVCTRLPHPTIAGRRITKVWQVSATTNAILELADHLAGLNVERVVVESTSDYWRPFVYLLEAAGVPVWLVNAHDVKNVPGRPKTDKLDAVWLAKLAERGMLRPSFIPPPEIRMLRDYTRLRVDLVRDRARHAQRLEKLLEDALLTELPGGRFVSCGGIPRRVVSVRCHGRSSGYAAGSVVVDGAWCGVADADRRSVRAVSVGGRRGRDGRVGRWLSARSAGCGSFAGHPALLWNGLVAVVPVLVGGRRRLGSSDAGGGAGLLLLDPGQR
jgi:hypothetical protein